MKSKIKETILAILEQKRRDGDVLPFATSIEVAIAFVDGIKAAMEMMKKQLSEL